MQTKTFESQVKAASESELIVEHFISTEQEDRGGDVMRADGMKINGRVVVLLEHGTGPMGREPIAKPLSIKPGNFQGRKGIVARTQFYDDEVGRRLWGKTTQGFAPNWSIGYTPLQYVPTKSGGRDVTSWELLEYSLVGVPMNPGAQTMLSFKVQPFTIGSDPMGSEDHISVKGFKNTSVLFKYLVERTMQLRDESLQRGLRKMLGRID